MCGVGGEKLWRNDSLKCSEYLFLEGKKDGQLFEIMS